MHPALLTTVLTMLELAILGLLKERAMHGYELKRQLGQRLGFFWTVSFGSLYPTLKKLEQGGLVEKVLDPEQRSRRRQVYRITPAGEDEFLELISEGAHSAWEEDKFPLRFAFFRYLNAETRLWLLERRRTYLQDKLIQGRQSLKRARRGRSDPYTLSLMRHGVEVTEHDITWIDELIAAERATQDRTQSAPEAADPPATPDDQPPAAPAAGPSADERPRPDGNHARQLSHDA